MITSVRNDQVHLVQSLIKRGKTRKEEGLFVVEGIRICRELDPEDVKILYVSENFLESAKDIPETAQWLRRFRYETVTLPVMKAMADTQNPQGILALARQKSYELKDLIPKDEPACLIVLETLQDPGNLGTIIRAGEGAGVTGVIMDETTVDLYNPKVIRSTMGSAFRMPFVYTDSLADACETLKKAGIRLYAAHLNGAESYEKADYTGPCGFLIGNEANGLTDETAALADACVKIPMKGKLESLNAAVAASVLMFEAARQRRVGK